MKRAIQAAIPLVKKLFQNLRRSSSVIAAECISDPSLCVSNLRSSNSDFERHLSGQYKPSCFVPMSDGRLQTIRNFYNDFWEISELVPHGGIEGYRSPVDCPDTMFDPSVGIGTKYIGELLIHIDNLATPNAKSHLHQGTSKWHK